MNPSNEQLNRLCAESEGWKPTGRATGIMEAPEGSLLPDYTSDSSNDWRLLVDALRKEGYSVSINRTAQGKNWCCNFKPGHSSIWGEGQSDPSFSRAVALAYAKTKGLIE